ncbi:hypothetical protein VNO78_15154 [Psophocarpus tetragonolobus]|uniref:Plant bHLH transcription factor ACT-like domain-containing protein n=1 Tax=Psophocarpus tetragonolobus TaxID=3891 RepID=A0AAN9SE38_PSOTE
MTDKTNVVREAANYVKQLEERVKELENKKKSIIVVKKTVVSINDEASGDACVEELPEVKVTVLDKDVLIGIHCEKQNQSLLKIFSCLHNLHLSITRTSMLAFGTSTLQITIIAQMDDQYNMTIDDIVQALLRQYCLLSLKSQDMQK